MNHDVGGMGRDSSDAAVTPRGVKLDSEVSAGKFIRSQSTQVVCSIRDYRNKTRELLDCGSEMVRYFALKIANSSSLRCCRSKCSAHHPHVYPL